MRIDRIRTIVVSISIITVLAFFGFYVQVDTRHSRNMLERKGSFEAQEVARMQDEMNKLRQLQQELNNASFAANNALTQENKNAQRLKKKVELMIAQNRSLLDKMNLALRDKQAAERVKDELGRHMEDLTSQNAGLQKEVDLLRKNFDVAIEVRSRLAHVQESIDGLVIQKGRENILQMQMEALTREVEDTNQYLIEIRENRIAPKLVVPGEPAPVRPKDKINLALEIKYLEQVNDLKAQINILTNENAVLKEKYIMAQDITDQHKKVLDSGNQKAFALQTRLIETESALSQSEMKYRDLERNVASLRERYVANELEKEGLKIKLNQLSSELNDVRGKFLALLGKITDIFQSPGDISSSARYNLTSVIGVELFPNSTDTKK
jgi:chromosome segregation ATPase